MLHSQLSLEGEKALFYSVGRLLWCKYSHHGLVQAAMPSSTSLTMELGSNTYNHLSGTSASQVSTGKMLL